MGKESETGQFLIPSRGFTLVMSFLDLKEILCVLAPMNKLTHSVIKEENFLFFKKLLRTFRIPSSYELSDLIARENIFEVFKRAVTNMRTMEPRDLNPFAFYTDGGVDGNRKKYFLQNVWSQTPTLYSTKTNADCNIVSIISRRVEMPEEDIKIEKFQKAGSNGRTIVVPYERYI